MNSPLPTTPRPVVVVLGSGRSGTSLLMQALAALGMRVSAEMIEARRDNPQGYFEDARIVRIQADLMRSLGAWPYHHLPAGWLDLPVTAAAGDALRGVLRERLQQSDGLWGFKDPRTAPFLPLWQRLFAEEGIAPRYCLALREPGSILRSFMAAYATPVDTAEQVWLQRTCDALWHTRAACHLVHYEDWFSRPDEVIAGLARLVGVRAVSMTAQAIVRPDLNRAQDAALTLHNPEAQALYTALQACRGDGFDRESLLQTVAACRAGLT